jgi:glycosyltransferase involved in cell wall biosynthesis
MTDRRLRVLTLIANPSAAGGAERIAARTAMALDPARFERILCATRRPISPQLDGELAAAGVRVVRLQRRSRADIAPWLTLVRLLRRERIDVVHTHLFGSNVWGAILARAAGVRAVIAHEHGQAYSSGVRAAINRLLIAPRVDTLLCVCRADRTRMIELQGVSPVNLRVLPNGIPPSPQAGADASAVRAELGLGAETPVVSIVANLRPEKAVHEAVAAFGHVQRALPDAHMLVIGTGPELGRVEAAVTEHGLEGSVSLLGIRSDVPDLLAATDVAVLSSAREGCPMALLEYMAFGRAIVATDVGGVPDVIENGVHGLIVPPHDAEAMGAAIVTLLRDPDLGARLGAAARARQRREFTFTAMMSRIEDLYECLARAPRGR